VGFNRAVSNSARRLNYYKLAEILFNDNARKVFCVMEGQESPTRSYSQEEYGICLGYLGLFISIIGQFSESNQTLTGFYFKGSRSVQRLRDGTLTVLRPREPRFSEAIGIMTEKAHSILQQGFDTTLTRSKDFYRVCDELSRKLLS
jgi:hypothetical protein